MRFKGYHKRLVAILLCSLFVFHSYGEEVKESAVVEYPRMDLLVVIDISGSMNPKSEQLRDIMKMVSSLVLKERIVNQPEILVFNEEEQFLSPEEFMKEVFTGETNVIRGINAADQWLKKKQGGLIKPGILIFSDLYATCTENSTHDKPNGYTVREAVEDQKRLDQITNDWKVKSGRGEMAYLCLTWNDESAKEEITHTANDLAANSDKQKSIPGVQFEMSDQKMLDFAMHDEDIAKKVVGQTMGVLVGQELEWVSEGETQDRGIGNIYPPTAKTYERFVMVRTNGDKVYFGEKVGGNTVDESKAIPPFWEFDQGEQKEKLYIIKDPDKVYTVHTDHKGDQIFTLDIPQLKIGISFSKITPYENEDFYIYVQFMTNENDYRRAFMGDDLFMRISDENNNFISKGQQLKLDKAKNRYQAKLNFKKEGDYKIQIFSSSDRAHPIMSRHCMVKSKAVSNKATTKK